MQSQRKYLLRYIGVWLGLFLFAVPALAYAAGFQHESQAQTLNDLGLYAGVSQQGFDPDLGAALNRETGIVMLIRLFGQEAEAAKVTNADQILSKFSDAAEISAWAKNAVAYAVQKGLVVGYPDGTLGAKRAMEGKAYCTLILKQLGYTPDYNQAPAELAARGGLSEEEGKLFINKALIKDDLVGISYRCLTTENQEGQSVLEQLVGLGVVDNQKMENIVLNFPELRSALTIQTPSPAPVPVSVPPLPPTVSPSNSGHSSSIDLTKPVPTITQTEDNVVIVKFSEPVVSSTNNNGAKNLSNYKLLGSNDNFVENAASVSESIPNLQYSVKFDSLIKTGYGEFTVCIVGISDASGNIMDEYRQKVTLIPFSITAIK